MAVSYEIRIHSPAGVFLETLTGQSGNGTDNSAAGYLSLSYAKGVNEIGMGAFTINAESAALASLVADNEAILDTQVEFWRRDDDNGIANYCDFYGFLRDDDYETDDNGIVTYRAILVEQNDLLRRAIVAYRDGKPNRSLFSAVATETILKTLVTRNATASGTTADGRDVAVDAWGAFVSVASDNATGTTQTQAVANRNLHEVLREIAEAGGLDLIFTKTGDRAWQFNVASQTADDRTNSATFSLSFGNMSRPRLVSNRRSEATRGIVGGQGEGMAQVTVTRTGDNYDSTVNSYETWVSATDQSTTAGLNSAGDERLEQMRARTQLSFGVIQVQSCLYGKHYFKGSVVKAQFLSFNYQPRIRRVEVTYSATAGTKNPETIMVTLGDV